MYMYIHVGLCMYMYKTLTVCVIITGEVVVQRDEGRSHRIPRLSLLNCAIIYNVGQKYVHSTQ